MIKIFFLVFCAGLILPALADNLPLDVTFNRADANGVPYGWYLNGFHAYKPAPEISYEPNGTTRIIHFSNVAGKSGFGLCGAQNFPAQKGESLFADFEACGSGTVWFRLQVYAGGKWGGILPEQSFTMTPNWKKFQLEVPVMDLPGKKTDRIMVTFGSRSGADFRLKNIKLTTDKSSPAVMIATKIPPKPAAYNACSFLKAGTRDHIPYGWYFIGGASLLPRPAISYEPDGTNGRIIKFADVTAKSGFLLALANRLNAQDGDTVLVKMSVRGKGKAFAQLQVFCSGSWLGCTRQEPLPLTPEWKSITLKMPVANISRLKPTDQAMFTFGAGNGAEIEVKELNLKVKSSDVLSGNIPFPRQWTVFLPLSREFMPSGVELSTIPSKLDGVAGKSMLYNGMEFDLTSSFGGKQQANRCAWLYAELNAPEAGIYTIGAGADWWMEFFLNGKSVFSTMSGGNIKHPPRMKDHLFTVNLNKGRNVLAVRFVTGSQFSKISFGGPLEIRDANRKFRMKSVLASDSYDLPNVKRTGAPMLIQGYPTTGTWTPTGQGVYTANPEVRFSFDGKNFVMPRTASGNYAATGIRIQSFGRLIRQDSMFRFDFKDKNGKNNAVLELEHRANHPEIQGCFMENGKKTGEFSFPYTVLPADLLFCAAGDGRTVLTVSSLADSSFRSFSAKCDFFARLGDESFSPSVVFSSLSGKTAELVVDNYEQGLASLDAQKAMNPLKLDIRKTFDPVKEGWKLAFADEFNGGKIDWNAWACALENRKNISLDGKGFLVIKNSFNDQGNLIGGGLSTKKRYKYGYFEARVRFTQQPGWWSFNFLYAPSVGNPMIDGMEIDIYEDYYMAGKNEKKNGKNILDHNLHCIIGGVFKSWNYNTFLSGDPSDFHVIACKWTPFEISYYMDGKLMGSSANHSPYDSVTFDAVNHANGIAPLDYRIGTNIFGEWAKNPKNANKTIPETYMADYVRIYEYPTTNNPSASWTVATSQTLSVSPGENLTLEAAAVPSLRTGAPIVGAYLFDSGNVIDYKRKPPYKFNLSITDEYYRDSNYVQAGRAGIKAPISGLHAYSILVQDANGNAANTPVLLKLPLPAQKSTPYQGKAQLIPGIINFSFYDEGGNGVAYADDKQNTFTATFRPGEGVDTTGSGGIGVIHTGEWLNCTVDIQKAGFYRAILKYGTPVNSNNRVVMLLDKDVIGTFRLPAHKADHWSIDSQTVLDKIELPAGRHTLKLLFLGGFNIGKLEFVPISQ